MNSLTMYSKSFFVWWITFYFLFTIQETGSNTLNPSEEFIRYRLVQPSMYHGRTKREITSTSDTKGTHHSDVTVNVDIDGEDYVLDLRLNEDLVTENHVLSYQKNGETVLHTPKREELDLCQYKGEVRGKPGSWVAVSTCRGIRGVIYDSEEMWYIEPAQAGIMDSQHFIYNHSDLKDTNITATLTKTFNNSRELYNKENIKMKRVKRKIHQPTIANQRSLFVELVFVVDNREYRKNGGNLRVIHQRLKDLANIINSIFAPLNIFIALVGVKVWSERDEIYLNDNATKTLETFMQYRASQLLSEIPNDHTQLLTNQVFSERIVGKAYVGKMCTVSGSGGLVSEHSKVIGIMAAAIAHEMGHNFGMQHDSEICECPGKKCIMSSSSTSIVPFHWSSCSLKSLAYNLYRGVDYCLRNKPRRLLDSPTCGNGFVEAGEQCDCGLGEEKSGAACLACCEPRSCMLRSNASCAAGPCCDFQTCQLKPRATLCRAADLECDLPEYCSGQSEFCPTDVYKMDTTPCGDNKAYCVRGKCRSHSSQCRLLWGLSSVNGHHSCYKRNHRMGNCYDPHKNLYYPCKKEDAMCGRLQCMHYNNELEFEISATVWQTFLTVNNTITSCHSAITDLGLKDEDPSMVPDGAICGEDKMCMNQRCLSVTLVRKRIANKSYVCPSDCSGHGVCNSKGNCHCDTGFAPPLCDKPGAGGSYDSGTASDVDVLNKFMVAMYVIFLGILPLILLASFLIYCSKKKNKQWWRNPNKKFENLMMYFKPQNGSATSGVVGNINTNKLTKAEGEKSSRDKNMRPKLKKEDIKVITNSE